MSLLSVRKPFLILVPAGLFASGFLVWFVLFSLNPGTKDGLPPIRLGHDKCSLCGMIISDKRFAARVQSKAGDGSSNFYTFDDLGCFIEKIQQNPQLRWSGFVYDFNSLDEIELGEANFERGSFQTPMGSGWIARKHGNKETIKVDQILQQ